MSRENLVILILVAAGLAALAVRYWGYDRPTGTAWYAQRPDGSYESVPLSEVPRRPDARYSLPRTVGVWVAALSTLAILSFLYRDNPFYRLAEHAFVGISAAYWMMVGFWSTLVNQLFGKLFPRAVKFAWNPGMKLDDELEKRIRDYGGLIDYGLTGEPDGLSAPWWQLMDFASLIPLALGIMLLWRLAPRGHWIARWPLAFVLGTTAGLRLIVYLESDFIKQISATILPLFQPRYEIRDGEQVLSWATTLYDSMNNVLLVAGVLCALLYFFFSLEHRGPVGAASRVGIWVLMITFGAGFGYTVMGRIALITGRFQFLVSDWLNLVPP